MTLYDVAERADVSPVTARKVLRGDATVRSYIRERVLKATRELDYQPNLVARALKERALKVVPISVGVELDQIYFGSLARHLSGNLVQVGMEPALCFNPEHLVRMSRSLSTSASIIVAGFDVTIIRALTARQKVVTVDACLRPLPNMGNVEVDFPAAYRHAVEVLLRQGRRRIAICSAHYVRARAHGWPDPKFDTVVATLHEAGLAPVGPVFATPAEFGAWISDHPRAVDALFCQNDETAARAFGILAAHGLRSPDDLLVIGCDGDLVLPGTWTIRVDTAWLATEAVGLLQRLLAGEIDMEPRRYHPVLVDSNHAAIEIPPSAAARRRLPGGARRGDRTISGATEQ